MGSLQFRSKAPLFIDQFRYVGTHHLPGSESLPDTWTIVSGNWTTSGEQILEVLEEGELLYDGIKLKDLSYFISDNSNFRLVVRIYGKEDLKFELRGRRVDANNYISLFVDFENDQISLRKSNSGTVTTLKTKSYDLQYDGRRPYNFELWMFDNTITACVNMNDIMTVTEPDHRTADGFSLSVPAINEDHPITFNAIGAFDLTAFNDPQFEDDPSNLQVMFRKLIKTEIETPSTRDYASFTNAHKLYEKYKDRGGRINQEWAAFGYPIRKPPTDDFLK